MNITREQFKKLAKKHLIALQGYDVNETIEIFGVGKLYDDIVKSGRTDINTEKVTRVNVIDDVRHSFFNFKYKWSLRKYWIGWFKRDLKRCYYSKVYGFNMNGYNGTMIPTTGKGKFVSVYSKGKIIQIKHESGYEYLEYDEIRIIPCKENHGVMVERFKNGKMCERNHMDLNQFNKGIIFASNVEQLAAR